MSSKQEVQHSQVPCACKPSLRSSCLWCKCLSYSTSLFNSYPRDQLQLDVRLSPWLPRTGIPLLDLDP